MRLGYDELGLGSARCAKMQMQTQVSWDYWRIDLHALCMDNWGSEYSGAVVGVASETNRQTRAQAGENQSARVVVAAGNAEKGVVRRRIVVVGAAGGIVGGVRVTGLDVDQMFVCNWW
jgi:hypothetical protein